MRPLHAIATAFVLSLGGAATAFSQSTATISGTVTDPSGAVVAGAQVTAHGNATGTDRVVPTDGAGLYTIPSLQPGDYSIRVVATGFSAYTIKSLMLQVDQRTTINAQLGLSSAGETIQVESTAPLIDAQTITVGQVIDQRTVQQIPLNGRHFLDLTQLVPGSVVPPANGSLTSASRGLGANSFITSGGREDSANFMINGVNLNDLTQNQITFQPSINTTAEFKISNSTYSAEYGRSSGSIVNVATRSGTNAFHGEAFDYGRNNYFDARNFFNRKGSRMNALRRQNFGGAISGPIFRDRTFFFLSYEGLRQSQDLLLTSNVLSPAQRQAFQANPNAAYARLLQFVPAGNNATGTVYSSSSPGPVKTDQFSGDLSHKIAEKDSLHGYYAWQQDARTEPNLQGNTIPGFGDHRTAHRQVATLNEVHLFSPNVVNEARLGFNRIAISFQPNNAQNPQDFGLNTGVTYNQGLPQIVVSDIGLNFGGPAGFPQGRFGTTGIFSDTLSLTRGKHSIKTGGEFRRFVGANFTQDTGSVTFASTANFIAGGANSFTVTPTRVSNRLFIGSAAGFVQDSWKLTPRLIAELGFRFEWNGTPAEGGHRFVNFLPTSSTLAQVNEPYQQNYNYEPRVGFSWDPFGQGKTILRAGFAIMADQPAANVATGLAGNPPNAAPQNTTAPSGSTLSVGTLFSAGAAALAPSAVNTSLRNAYTEGYNLNLQHDLGGNTILQLGYIGSVGRHLRLRRNINQFVYPTGVATRPFARVSATSVIRPNSALNNIAYVDSDSFSDYNALWVTVRKTLWHGVSLNSTYTWSKSMDLNSIGSQGGSPLQNNFNPRGDYGLSDFDVRSHFVFSGTWELPFRGNRLKEGWLLANITQLQGGNPLNVTTTSTYNGTANTIRPMVAASYSTGRHGYASNGNILFINGTGCTGARAQAGCTFYAQPAGFGTLRRNALIGPGFADTDLSLQKTTRLAENVSFVLRLDAFDLLNHPNFYNPTLSLSALPTPTAAQSSTATSGSTFGQINQTRGAVGDAGSSRQLQFAARVTF